MEITIQLDSIGKQLELFGPADANLRMVRDALDVRITARQNNLLVAGKADNVNRAVEVIDKMQKHLLKAACSPLMTSAAYFRILTLTLSRSRPRRLLFTRTKK